MKDPKTREEKYQPLEKEEQDYENLMHLYLDGKELFKQCGYLVEPSTSGLYGFHKIYRITIASILETEINYPDEFKVWREIATAQERSDLNDIMIGWINRGEYWAKVYGFWRPIVKPNKNKNSPLYVLTEQLLKEAEVNSKRTSGSPEASLATPQPVVSMSTKKQVELAPVKWIPLAEWFPEAVQQVSIYDVFTIFPKAEADLLALMVGRACVGRSNLVPPGYSEPIIHSSRMAAFILGEDPGLGKTTLMKALFSALETVGYRVETFESMASKFNLGPIISADVVYKDDITDDEFKGLTKTGSVKSLISSADFMKVQDKGVDAYSIFPSAALFINTNSYNPRVVYNVDPGTADRIKLISTVREAELLDLDVSPLSQGSPDYRPFIHLDYLAEKIGVSKHTIMLWVARQCTDRFLSLLSNKTDLEQEVDRITLNLREPMSKDSTSQFLTAVVILGSLSNNKISVRYRANGFKPISVDKFQWATLFYDFLLVAKAIRKDPELLDKLRRDFEESHNDFLHPYIGLSLMDLASLNIWVMEKSPEFASLAQSDPLDYLTKALAHIRMRNGLEFSKDIVWVNKAYKRVEYYLPQVFKDFKYNELLGSEENWIPN